MGGRGQLPVVVSPPPSFSCFYCSFSFILLIVFPHPHPRCVSLASCFFFVLSAYVPFVSFFRHLHKQKKKEHEGEDMLNPLRTKRMTRKCLYSRPRPFRPRPLILLANERQICMVCSQSVPILFDSFPCSFRSFSFTFVPPYCVACALSVRLIYK